MPDNMPQNLKVLVVEDSEALRDLVRELLADLGYVVHLASSGNDALALIKSGAPLDLIFTDIVLPGGQNGFELVKEARETHPGIRALFMTGHNRHQVIDQIRAVGGVLLNKPFRRKDMNEAIAKVMA